MKWPMHWKGHNDEDDVDDDNDNDVYIKNLDKTKRFFSVFHSRIRIRASKLIDFCMQNNEMNRKCRIKKIKLKDGQNNKNWNKSKIFWSKRNVNFPLAQTKKNKTERKLSSDFGFCAASCRFSSILLFFMSLLGDNVYFPVAFFLIHLHHHLFNWLFFSFVFWVVMQLSYPQPQSANLREWAGKGQGEQRTQE